MDRLAVVGTEFQQIYSAAAQLDGKGIIVRDFEQLANTTTLARHRQMGLRRQDFWVPMAILQQVIRAYSV